MKDVNFDLTDADGVSHQYRVTLFSCDENARLQLMFAAPLMQMIGQALAAFIPAVGDRSMAEVFKDMDTLTEALRKVDWTLAPGALIQIPQELERRGGAVIVAQVFAHTYRQIPIPELQNVPTAHGDGNIDSDYEQHLALPDKRDEAFGDGNYQEYWRAAAMVLIVNFTRFGRKGSESLSGLAESLMSSAGMPSTPTNATQPPRSGSPTGSGPLPG